MCSVAPLAPVFWFLVLMLLAPGCATLEPLSGRGGGSYEFRELERQRVEETRRVVLGALDEVSASLHRSTNVLARLEAHPEGWVDRANGVFAGFLEEGLRHRRELSATLGGAHRLAQVAGDVKDPDMQRALLRLVGPRLQAALFGTQLLAVWVDFLQISDAVVQRYPFFGIERMYWIMARVQNRMEPPMKALASLESAQAEALAATLPGLMGELTAEFGRTQDAVRLAVKRDGQVMAAMQIFEMVTMVSAMKLTMPRLPPAAPLALGASLVAGADGVRVGTQVVSAEWAEWMRELVRAGVLSAPVVGVAVRIQANQVLMSQSSDELPKGVRDALGDGPEVRGMRQTDRAGAGMSESPRHHVLPREHREWFEQRGFTEEMDIDQFCVRMEQAEHEAIHGGGDWRQGRKWPGEWNQMIMRTLRDAELEAGRMLTRNEVLDIVSDAMSRYNIPMNFTPWSGR